MRELKWEHEFEIYDISDKPKHVLKLNSCPIVKKTDEGYTSLKISSFNSDKDVLIQMQSQSQGALRIEFW